MGIPGVMMKAKYNGSDIIHPTLLDADPPDFTDIGEALKYLDDAVLLQGAHPVGEGLRKQRLGARRSQGLDDCAAELAARACHQHSHAQGRYAGRWVASRRRGKSLSLSDNKATGRFSRR